MLALVVLGVVVVLVNAMVVVVVNLGLEAGRGEGYHEGWRRGLGDYQAHETDMLPTPREGRYILINHHDLGRRSPQVFVRHVSSTHCSWMLQHDPIDDLL